MLNVHSSALINAEPVRSERLSRPIPSVLPEAWLGEGVMVDALAYIQRDVVVGDGTMIGVGARIFTGARIGRECLIGAGVEIGRNAVIGNHVKVLSGAHVCGGTRVGDYSVIGMQVVTTDDDDPLNWQEKVRKPVTIGERVQIGAGAVLLPGVEVGDGAIVAAGAVVRWRVPAGATVMGVPARARAA